MKLTVSKEINGTSGSVTLEYEECYIDENSIAEVYLRCSNEQLESIVSEFEPIVNEDDFDYQEDDLNEGLQLIRFKINGITLVFN